MSRKVPLRKLLNREPRNPLNPVGGLLAHLGAGGSAGPHGIFTDQQHRPPQGGAGAVGLG